MGETKIIYHIDDEDTPYLIKLPVPADRVTLGDFKNALNRPNYKFFFKSMDDDFGVVKEEIIDDDAHLPCFNGRVVSWLVPAESSASDTQSQSGDVHMPAERVGGIGDSRPPSFHANASVVSRDEQCDTCTESESVLSAARRVPARINGHSKHDRHHHHRPGGGHYETSTMMSSDLETTSFFDSEDDTASRFSTVTDTTTSMASKYGRHRRRRRRHRPPPISRASSFSSITDSTMSLNIITVTLNMDTVNFLGISIVGQSNKGGDGGIYVGSIMKGGAVAQDGRVEPGDMILEVNGISFENMSNDDAVKTLREAVQKPGPITLVVAKCWDPNPKGYFTVPRQEPVRPIDPSAWVAHTTALREQYMGRTGPSAPSISNMTSTSSSLTSSIPESERFDDLNLTINTDMATVVKAMAQPDSGLEIRDRMWLKITIPNAFIGADLVDWLFTHVDGFADRRDARKYACNLLKSGYIRHTVNKLTFSEQCYYVFGDYYGGPPVYPDLSAMSLEDVDSVSEADRDTLAPLPPPAWNNQYPYSASSFLPHNVSYIPPHAYAASADSNSYVGSFVDGAAPLPAPPSAAGGNGSAGSVHSASVVTKDCTCLVTTYNQLRKLWENKEKQNELNQNASQHNGGALGFPPGDFTHLHASMRGSNSSLVHNACSCMPLPLKWPSRQAAERLLSKTICFDHPEPNNNSKKSSTSAGSAGAKSSSLDSKSPSVDSKSPVDTKSPCVDAKPKSSVDCKSPSVDSKSPSVDTKSPAVEAGSTSISPTGVAGSSHSGSSKKENKDKGERKSASPMGSGSDSDAASLVSGRRVNPGGPVPGQPSNLGQMPPEMSGSRQSFRMAMGNPSLIEAEDLE